MNTSTSFYLCPICFEVSDTELKGHKHPMIKVDLSKLSDESRQPVMDASGRLTTAMPRWFVEATTTLHKAHKLSA